MTEEQLARAIARHHGGAMTYRDREGTMQTVASSRGYGHWGHSPEKYADSHWQEYRGAAQMVLHLVENCDLAPSVR